uniref:hypothetical protein n=1 Tax=Yoonia sp. TaxID=2212373 RepID=UPI0040484DB0
VSAILRGHYQSLSLSGRAVTPDAYEYNGKIRPQPDWENSFSRASGGGNGTAVEPSPIQGIDFNEIFFTRCTLRELSTLQASYMAMPSGESGILPTSSK